MITLRNKKDEARRTRRNQLLVGLLLLAVMLFSVIGYGFQTQDTSASGEQGYTVTYQGYDFVYNGAGLWLLALGGGTFGFQYTPDTLDFGDALVHPLSSYSGKPLYVIAHDELAKAELYRTMDLVVLRRQAACLDPSVQREEIPLEGCDASLPVKTCEDNVIIIAESSTKHINQIDNCVFIGAPAQDLVAVVDEFLFKSLGIVQ